MSEFYEWKVTVDSRDVDGSGFCKASALLGYLQEAATQASIHGGFSREATLEAYGGFWMLTRMRYRLERPLRWSEELTIRTWHRGGRGASLYRDYDIFADGQRVGECVSQWVLASLADRRLIRLSTVTHLEGTDGGALCKTETLRKLRMPETMEQAAGRHMNYSDTDINGHVNNTRYADFACDALGMEGLGADRFLSQMQIGYLAECRPGDILHLETGRENGTDFVRGMDEEGKSRFEAAVIFGEVLP